MTPTERSLYAMTRFEIDDQVTIAGEMFGTITGIKVTTSGEDEYRVFFFDGSDTPTERWFRDSLLESADDDEPDMSSVRDSNVVAFPCRCEREDIAAARSESRRATRH